MYSMDRLINAKFRIGDVNIPCREEPATKEYATYVETYLRSMNTENQVITRQEALGPTFARKERLGHLYYFSPFRKRQSLSNIMLTIDRVLNPAIAPRGSYCCPIISHRILGSGTFSIGKKDELSAESLDLNYPQYHSGTGPLDRWIDDLDITPLSKVALKAHFMIPFVNYCDLKNPVRGLHYPGPSWLNMPPENHTDDTTWSKRAYLFLSAMDSCESLEAMELFAQALPLMLTLHPNTPMNNYLHSLYSRVFCVEEQSVSFLEFLRLEYKKASTKEKERVCSNKSNPFSHSKGVDTNNCEACWWMALPCVIEAEEFYSQTS